MTMPRSSARSTTSLAGKLRAKLRTNAALSPCLTTNPLFAVAFFFPAFFFFEAICCLSLITNRRGSPSPARHLRTLSPVDRYVTRAPDDGAYYDFEIRSVQNLSRVLHQKRTLGSAFGS